MLSAGQIFAGVAAALHVFFFYLESVAFPKSAGVQRLFLGRKAEQHNVDLVRPLLLNQGAYNLFLALGTLWGLWTGNAGLTRFTLWTYVAAGVVLFFSSPSKYRGAVLQLVPALVAAVLL
jgi:putative membrane protein